jgi:hypothetical protein
MKSSFAKKLLMVLWSIASIIQFSGSAFSADEPNFKSPAAVKAKTRYLQSVAAASKSFMDELDRGMKFALQSNSLEEANQINAAKKQVVDGAAVTVDFKRAGLVSARNVYRDSISAAKGQYYKDLELALREATKAGDLQEANAIDTLRKTLETELASRKISGKTENGLWLTIGNKRELWLNKTITLPSNKTKVSIDGVLLLTAMNAKTIRIRSAKASGSERLKFTVDGKLRDFQIEGKSHRYIVVEPQPGSDKLRLHLGESIAANDWAFGPLEWSINTGKWHEIPLHNLIAVE